MNTTKEKPLGAGGRSIRLLDLESVFKVLPLKQGSRFLDMACGRGDYAVAASGIVGEEGLIYAIDLWEEGIAELRKEVEARGIENVKTFVADVSHRMPLEDDSIDVCLLATVLHDLIQEKVHEGALREAARVLRLRGFLVIIEFKKKEGPPGPPLKIRLSPEEVERIVIPFGFKKKGMKDISPYTYLLTFVYSGMTG